MKRINVTKPSLPKKEDYIKQLDLIWDSSWLTNNGPIHEKLKLRLNDYLKVNNTELFCNGHIALEYAIETLNITGEVITTPFTFASTTQAIMRKGLKPVFCDINDKDFTIDVKKIESLITTKTSAIIPVHVFGNICDVEGIQKIADKYNLMVIYDAAHAFGIEYRGKGIGLYGDISMFSFHATKVFNTIEGGALTYGNKKYNEILSIRKNFGLSKNGDVIFVGGNGKMNEFQAAMGICNLKKVDEWIFQRRRVFDRYVSNLKSIESISLPSIKNEVKSNYSYFPIIVMNPSKNRDYIADELNKGNVFPRKYFYPLTNDFNCNNFNSQNTPVAKYISDNILTLPMYPELKNEEIDYICEIIKGVFK